MILILAALSACSQKSEEAPESGKSDAGIITPEKLSGLDVKTAEAKLGRLEFDLVTHANVSPAPGSLNIIAAPISGRILKIYKHEGERVAAGEALLEIESMEYTNLVYEFLMSLEESNWRKARAERLKKLSEQKINSQSEYEEAEALYKKTLSESEAAYSRLKTIGLSEKEIEELKNKRGNTSSLKVRSQIGGVINEHLVELGKSANIYDKLLTVVDSREVLIKAFLAPEDARFINPAM
jgi:cobalt-zinc-cadmium efflux system membrane fusion protein